MIIEISIPILFPLSLNMLNYLLNQNLKILSNILEPGIKWNILINFTSIF